MNKSGDVANYKHHSYAETKDIKETNTNMQHEKGGHHEGNGQGPDHGGKKGMHLKNIHIHGSDHHKGNQSGTPAPAFPVLQGDIPGAQ